MPELTAQQLHDLMSPLWERDPELRPTSLDWRERVVESDSNVRQALWIFGLAGIPTDTATQLCESQMVRRLWEETGIEACRLSEGFVNVSMFIGDNYKDFRAPTKIQALASAYSAVLDAKEANDE